MTNPRSQYRARINGVVDYIEANLGQDLSLEELASAANFSKFHFHRVFAMMMGETLHSFIQRTRVEKAAVIIASDPTRAVTAVAYDCGFTSPQAFAKQFRRRFGMSATEWRRRRRPDGKDRIADEASAGGAGRSNAVHQTECASATKAVNTDADVVAPHAPAGDAPNASRYSKQGQVVRKSGQSVSNDGNAPIAVRPHIEYQQEQITWRYNMIDVVDQKVTVTVMDTATLAYIRHVGPYEGDGSLFERLWGKLMSWAGPRDLVKANTRYITVYHDSPDITDKDKLRISIGITVPQDTAVDGEVSLMTLEAGKYAIAEFLLGEEDYGEAWGWVYGTWLPESGFVPDDRPAFEEYPIDTAPPDQEQGSAVGGNKFSAKRRVNICVPVRPM